MADQTQSTGASTNTFYKGMMKDYNESYIGNDSWTHARNSVNNSHDGNTYVLGNEPSNLKCITLPAKMVGCIHLLDDQWLIYSTNNTNSYVGIFDESACTYEPLRNKNYTIANSNLGDIINFDCLALKTTNLITGVFRKRYDCERLVYWDDGLNPTRTMDLDNIPCTQTCSTPTPNCTVCVDTIYLDCEKVRIAPIVDHPCITVSKGKLPGTLPNGSYQVAIAYTINQLKVTDYIGLTEVQPIWSHENTSGSLDVHVSHIDSSFNEFELVVLSNINAQTVCKRIGYYNTAKGDIHIDRWDPEFVTVSVNEVVLRSEPIEKSDAMYTVNNYLLRIGTYSKFKFNYQVLANQITTNWVSVEYPKNYYQKGGNITGYMRDEVYAFFIRFVYNTGEFSESYHIPGRPITPGVDDVSVTGQDVYEAASRLTWQVYNTATPTGGFVPYPLNDGSGGIAIAQGQMAYWESDESYPSDKPDIWNSFPNIQINPLNLCGQPIRHHKMPDETIDPRLDLYNSANDAIRILGVKFNNIQHPVDNNGDIITTIVGYEILRGSREGNKSIIAKGLLNNMRKYSIPGNTNAGLFVNYPYNDLNPDSFLVDTNQVNSRPTGYNGDFLGTVWTNSKMPADSVQDIFSFHSPDTTFSKPYLNGNELKIYREHRGYSVGSFEVPYKHPLQKMPTAFVGLLSNMISLLNTIDAIQEACSGEGELHFTGTEDMPVDFTYKFPPFPQWPNITGSDAYGVTSWIMWGLALIIYLAAIVAWVIITGVLIAISIALNDAKIQKVYDIFFALMPKKQFAAQYTSHGYYNSYDPVNKGNVRRSITLANYLGSGIQQFGLGYQINNINRGASDVVLQLGGSISPTYKDDSRVTSGDQGVNHNESFIKNIASYYGAIKIPMSSQYGQLESIKQIPISTCIRNVYQTSTGSIPLFGGDIYVNRFTQKNTFFFFNTWLFDQPNMFEFNYTNYINIPYPRWWYNSELYKFHSGTSPVQYRSLDNTTAAGGISFNGTGLTLYLDSGFFYLFSSGVRDFYCESEVNTAYRDWEDDITKRFYDPYGFTSISGYTSMFRSDTEIITSGNYYKYDYSLSKSKLFNSHITWGETLPRDYNPYIAASCYVYRPNRVMYSLPQQDNSKKDNWRAFLPNNFKDFPSKVSSIKPVHKTGALFMMKYANPLMFMGVEELKLSDSGTKVTIGDGALFSSGGVSQLQSVVNSDESYEYGSNQSRFSSINCIHGVFWVSQNQGKVFQYGGGSGIQEISAGGMRWWFAKYLPSELLKKYPNYPLYDNPVEGVGTQMIYDNTHELIYITKKDYIPKDCGQTLNYNGNFTNKITVAPDSCPPGFSLQNGVCVPDIPNCPDGYTYDATQNLCVKTYVETINATASSTVTNLTRTPYSGYGYAVRVHSALNPTSTYTTLATGNSFWNINFSAPQTQAGQLNNGPANRLSIWGIASDGIIRNNYSGGGSVPPIGQWIGFDVCVNIPESKTYWVSIFGDNYYRMSLDGTVILSDTRGTVESFNYLHFYPVTLPAGVHILRLEGYNTGSFAGFGCEVFDLSGVAVSQSEVVQFLNAQTNYTNLDPLTIFTTRNKTQFTSNLYSCPAGYTLVNPSCDLPECKKTIVETVDPTYTAFAAKSNVQVIPSEWDNKECWEECSWTISYDPKIKAWVSFHDWIPSFLIPGRSHFMSVAPESGSIVDSIWKHNIRCDSYCNYYGVDYPFEIEFVSATGQTVNSMRSIEYLLETYNYSNDCRDKFHNLYENFDQAIVYNSEQNSGLLRLNLHVKNDPLGLLAYPQVDTTLGIIDIQYSKVENKYRFNQFWDITNNRGQSLPSPLNIPMFNVSCNGYVYPINPAYVNYSKNPLEHKKFRHNVNRVFLRRLVSGNNKFLFKISNQKTLQSPR
jgi:hypothetical protein